MEILALDLGIIRTGIARASAQARLAMPLKTVATEKLLTELKDIMAKEPAATIVIGLPRNTNGEDTDQTRWVRQWVAHHKDQLGVPVYWQDEYLTSHLVKSKKQNVKGDVDAQAAAIILDDWLKSNEQQRVLI